MTQTRTYFDLLDAFGQDGCPVCRLALAGVQHSFESINYDGVNDLGFRQQTRAAHGFCNRHAYQWLQTAHILGTALIYDQLLTDTTDVLERMRFRKASILSRVVFAPRRFRVASSRRADRCKCLDARRNLSDLHAAGGAGTHTDFDARRRAP